MLLRGEDADLWRSALQRATLESASGALQGLASQLLFTAETQSAQGQAFEAPADTAVLTTQFRARDLMDRSGGGRSLRLPSRLTRG